MTSLRQKLIVSWIFPVAASVSMALHQVLLGYVLMLVGLLIQSSLPQPTLSKPVEKRWTLLALGAVVLANVAFWTRSIPILPIVLWSMCAAVFAWGIVLGVRWEVRLFRESGATRPST